MVQLNDGGRTELTQRASEAREAREVRIRCDPELPLPGVALLAHERGAGTDPPEPAPRAHGQPCQLVVAERSVGLALGVRQRRHRDPLLDVEAAAQGEREVEIIHGATIPRTRSSVYRHGARGFDARHSIVRKFVVPLREIRDRNLVVEAVTVRENSRASAHL